MLSKWIVLAANLVSLAAAQTNSSLIPLKYLRFSQGDIKPTGWALDQAKVQADGLAGHLRDWYSFVANSIWVPGGTEEYSDMHEAAPYWFNGMVALPFLIGDERLQGQVNDFVDHILSTQQDDGWIGPEAPDSGNSTVPRLVWPRYLIMLGLIQYAEVNPSQADRVTTAMHKFLDLVHDIFQNNQQGDPSQGFQFAYQAVRWEELLYSVQWLIDNAPQGKEAQLIETMKMAKAVGFDWQHDWYTDATFPKEAVPGPETNMFTHGVNNGEALKSEALSYRISGDESAIQNTWDRMGLLYNFHGRASGTFGADEHFAGLGPSRGTEFCAIVEQMFSLSTIFTAFGNSSVLDHTEKLAYNAMPAASLADMWSHQYDQQVNQIWAKNLTEGPIPWGTNSPYSGVFGMESNYPCCTTNHPQGFPKFWAHSFLHDANDSTIFHALLGPSSLSTNLGSDNAVTVNVDTIYPFGSTLNYTVKAEKPLTLQIRIPAFAQTNKSMISVNGGSASPVQPDTESAFHAVEVKEGTTTIALDLDMPLQIEQRPNNAIAVHRGVLMYSIQVDHNTSETLGWRNTQANSDAMRLFPDTPPVWFEPFDNHTHDFTLQPTSEWRLAIDPSTLKVVQSSTPSEMPHMAFAPNNQPIHLTAQACQIEWGLANGTSAPPPTNPACADGGKGFEVKLTAFGATPLRIGEIPVVKIT